ncbi:G-protein coupled receptor 157 [Lingula anatina]|uniref:G-protein coupled receptor 157 n=1 Tax=Lingula anatina TaxID=7574 RepID=A0A1S3JP37_LINAN|nr:G-protein coupled receptor 157 [Lingula anatina]|eukprot:XP_013412130.1 G-protein coupled receptor 157 [Lingula anatina]
MGVTLSLTSLVYVILTLFFSVLSILGTLLIILVYFMYVDLRTTSRKIVVFLSIGDFINALSQTIGLVWYVSDTHTSVDYTDIKFLALCEGPAAGLIFGTIASCLWTVVLALYMYICIVRNRVGLAQKLITPSHVVCWMIPSLMVIILMSETELGYDEALKNSSSSASICWIRNVNDSNPKAVFDQFLWQVFSMPFWELTSVIVVAILTSRTVHHVHAEILREKDQHDISEETMAAIWAANKKMVAIPVVMVFVRIWGIARFLVTAITKMAYPGQKAILKRVDSHPAMVILMMLQGIGDGSQGLGNAMLFCFFTKSVRTRLWDGIKRAVSCKWRHKRREKSTRSDHGSILADDRQPVPAGTAKIESSVTV